MQCMIGVSRRQGPWQPIPRLQKLVLWIWNVTSLMGKEPELVCEDEGPTVAILVPPPAMVQCLYIGVYLVE